MLSLTKSLATEFAPKGALINAVCVGLIRSAQNDQRWASSPGDETIDEYYARLAHARGAPLGRAGDPEEVAQVVAFLASPDAGYVTGTTVNVDGGATSVL